MLSKLETKHYLTGLIFLAAILRLAFLGSYPSKLNVDEAAKAYNAYSLIQTGKTFRGLSWPLYFNDYDYTQPSTAIIYNYLVVPAVFFLGLTEFAVRLPAALLGTLTVWLVYLLSFEIFKNKKMALISAFLICVSPWHIYLSRWGIEPVTYPAFFLAGYLLFLRGRNNILVTALSGLVLGLCMYTYPAALVIVPIFILMLLFYERVWITISRLLGFFVPFALVISPLASMYLTNPLMYGHYNAVSVFTYFGERTKAIKVFIIQMLESFFLLSYLYPLLIIIFFFKSILNLKNDNNRTTIIFILVLIIVSLIPANLTYSSDRFTVLFIRGTTIMGLVEILAGKYIYEVLSTEQNNSKYKILNKALLVATVTNAFLLMWLYSSVYSPSNGYREIGYKKAYAYIKDVEYNYDNVLVDVRENQPFIYLLFYYKYPPSLFLSQNVVRVKTSKYDTEYVKSFGKYHFCDSKNLNNCPELRGRTLILTTPDRRVELKDIYNVEESGKITLTIKEGL